MTKIEELSEIFTPGTIKFYRENKHEITQELLETLREFGNPGKQIALDILDTEIDHEKYYLDAYGNRISFNGNKQLKKAHTKMKLYPIHEQELKKCSEDIFYFMDNYVKITTPKGVNFPDLRSYQRDFINVLRDSHVESIISLQPRQAGKSVTLGIYGAHDFIFNKDINIGIAANKSSMAREFVDKIKKIILNLPMWMKPGVVTWNKSSLEGENNIRILSDSTSSDSFRGFSIHKLFVDETAFIPPNLWSEFADSIFPSQSGLSTKQNILISTANGQNHFYEIWRDAGETLETSKNGYVRFEVDYRDTPRYKTDGTKYESEEFRKDIIKKYGSIYFQQNYGNSFIGSSNTLIKGEKLAEYKPRDPEFVKNPGLRIYSEPKEKHSYILSADAAKDGSDNFAVQVLDITNFEFKQVAVANLQIDYLRMPKFIETWARHYNNAFVVVENNEGAGQSVADRLWLEFGYENLYFDKTRPNNGLKKKKKYPGFRTTKSTRDIILQTLKTLAESDKLEICDKNTLDELNSFILINDKYQADSGKKDDLVMALALCFAVFVESKNFNDMREVVELLDSKEEKKVDITNYLAIGSFDSFSDNDLEDSKREQERDLIGTFGLY